MTTIINNNTFNLNFAVNNNFGSNAAAALGGGFSTQLAAGLVASYFQPLFASAFASATLPMLLNFQGDQLHAQSLNNIVARSQCDAPFQWNCSPTK